MSSGASWCSLTLIQPLTNDCMPHPPPPPPFRGLGMVVVGGRSCYTAGGGGVIVVKSMAENKWCTKQMFRFLGQVEEPGALCRCLPCRRLRARLLSDAKHARAEHRVGSVDLLHVVE